MLRPGDFGMNEFSYPDSKELKKFHRKNKLTNCILNQVFSPQAASIFFRDLAYDSQDIGRCISLIPNAIAITLLNKYGKDSELSCIEKIGNGELIAAVCNNEATNHGSNLNAMVSYIKYNDDSSYDIHINKKMITNVGASDLLFVCVPILGKAENNFVILLLDGHAIPQRSVSSSLHGLSTCPTGSIEADLVNCKDIRFIAEGKKSLLVMRHIYNMERFLIGCIMTGILKRLLNYALTEKDNDSTDKFNNQYLQDKIISLFDTFIKFDSLIKNCVTYMDDNQPSEPLLSLIKLASIHDVHQAIMTLKEIYGGKSYFKDHITTRLLKDHEAIYNLGGTSELMKKTLYNDLQNAKTRVAYV